MKFFVMFVLMLNVILQVLATAVNLSTENKVNHKILSFVALFLELNIVSLIWFFYSYWRG